MSKIFSASVIFFSLIAGIGGGWLYQITIGNKTNDQNTATATNASSSSKSSQSTEQTLEECLTEVWGSDKYAAISANSSLATTEDNLASLKCYKD